MAFEVNCVSLVDLRRLFRYLMSLIFQKGVSVPKYKNIFNMLNHEQTKEITLKNPLVL